MRVYDRIAAVTTYSRYVAVEFLSIAAMNDSVLQQYSILCVDPDAEARAVLQEVLGAFRIVFAANGYESLRAMHYAVFDAYVLEVWLPDWSGIQLCRALRKTDPHVPVLFCTGAARDEDRTRAMRAGASGYLCKPIDPSVLLSRLRVLIELTELEGARAIIDEQRAMHEELSDRVVQLLERSAEARQSAASAIERSTRLKAWRAFAGSGGTLAHFERLWQPAFRDARAIYDGHSDSDSHSDSASAHTQPRTPKTSAVDT
jgi:DNA-binding response OmpR family regulator